MAASMVALRCQYCGATLDAAAASGDTVVCKSCGTAQRLMDARKYLDQVKLEIADWLRKAVPLGMDISQGATIDPVARHGVFINNVKPRLDTETTEYRFNMSSLLAQPLVTMPFLVNEQVTQSNQPKEVFLFQAKVQEVSALAVSGEAKKDIVDASGLAVTYAYLLNNVGLLRDPQKPDRFGLMGQNFTAAAQSNQAIAAMFPGLPERLQANSLVAVSADLFMSGRVDEAGRKAHQAIALYESATAQASQSMSSAIMLEGLKQERHIADALVTLGSESQANPTDDARLVTQVQAMARVVQQYPHLAGDPSRLHAITRGYAGLRAARRSQTPVRVLPGAGSVFYPFWVVDLKYSFTTGALWAKKGKEVSEYLLVAANAFVGGAWNSAEAVTDVFSARIQGGLFDGLTGKETSISGGGIASLLSQSTNAYLNVPGIPPLTSEPDATEMATAYLNASIMSDPRVRQKLRLSAPRVAGIVYAAGVANGGGFGFSQLGTLSPRVTGDPRVLTGLGV